MRQTANSLETGKDEDLIPLLPHNDQLMPKKYFARAVNTNARITGDHPNVSAVLLPSPETHALLRNRFIYKKLSVRYNFLYLTEQ